MASSSFSPMAPDHSFVSSNPWENLYSKEEYKKKPRHVDVTRHKLHYLIGLNYPFKKITQFAGKGGGIAHLDHAKHSLSPIMLATAMGRVDVAKHLLELAVNAACIHKCLNQSDRHGFTILHHATISAPELVQTLIRLGANPEPRGSSLSVPDLEKLTNLQESHHSSENLFWADSKGTLIPWKDLPSSSLKKKTGIEIYTDVSYYREPAIKYKLWKTAITKARCYDNPLPELVPAWLKRAPKLIMKRHPELDSKQLGVFAGEPLKCGTIIGPYSGLVNFLQTQSSFENAIKEYLKNPSVNAYQIQQKKDCLLLNAKTLGNLVSRLNNGFPNVSPMEGRLGEIPVTSVFVVIDPDGIRETEEALWCYKNDASSWWDQKLLGVEKMKTFYSKRLKNILNDLDDSASEELNFFKSQYSITALQFALNNPKAIIYLHFSNTVKSKEWIDNLSFFRANNKFLDDFLDYSTRTLIFKSFLCELNRIDKEIESKYFEIKDLISNWILNKINSISVFHQLFALKRITETESLQSKDCWFIFITNLEKELNDYDWFEDQHSPLRENNANFFIRNYFSENPSEESALLTLESMDDSL